MANIKPVSVQVAQITRGLARFTAAVTRSFAALCFCLFLCWLDAAGYFIPGRNLHQIRSAVGWKVSMMS